MKTPLINLFALVSLIWIGSACSSVNVDKSRKADFSRYRTFAWMDSDVQAGKNPAYYNEIATQNLEAAVVNTLNEKGYKENTRNPDMLIGYHFFVEQRERTVSDPSPMYGPYMGWGRWGWQGWGPAWYGWGGGPRYRQEKYDAGTVVVDIVDAKTQKLVWRGSVEKAVDNPTQISRQLEREVSRIIDKVPEEKSGE
ncbi:DUF4136 domain-containing protein [Siphonobacter sp. SORGH_AS_0500]|uniref:DUF4136 domain-containing protein n=1 Tax=Siphonobacter sp. SORGH_AS_0500 TaxID=1864824 RepID=UPI0028660B3A|nr:DUF4136 domain-containing protein [Siphonobacter sp. SORGH_AS_0500]MDR6195975.1 hypothetical protein [Siphonobacter sp. SORGH_AS_0500]